MKGRWAWLSHSLAGTVIFREATKIGGQVVNEPITRQPTMFTHRLIFVARNFEAELYLLWFTGTLRVLFRMQSS